jgi:DNA-binding NtrC family response regulator
MTLANTLPKMLPWTDDIPLHERRSVLVLCASEERCNEIAWLLRLSGYRSSIVPDVPSAKMFLARCQPALIVADLRLPPGDAGGSLVDDLRAHYAGTLVLIVHDASSPSQVVPPGVCGYLSRPLDAGKFLALVNRAVAQAGVQSPAERMRTPGH